ncbi:M56 family metallopeptidase [Paenibacillus algorifonticola]|uniref:M56 family metallopeptidase n=1 Tax=Paenibacillus algorifonticola TaxID=684063 RepID=UPI001E34C616|nr:M56 family metallopeptidase [Paenibacillus algorifonticola]
MSSLTVAGTVVVTFIWLAQHLSTAIWPTKWRYVINKMAVGLYLFPVVLIIQWISRMVPFRKINDSSMNESASIVQHAQPGALLSFKPEPLFPELTISTNAAFFVIAIWAIGVVAFAAWQTYCYRRFLKQLANTSTAVPLNSEAVNQLYLIKQALGLKSKVRLAYSSSIQSPILVGLWKPVIYLPMVSTTNVDMSMIIRHELIHLKRKDIWVKAFTLGASALHWFNPLVHILRKDIHTWSELSCDEEVVKGMSHAERLRYGQTLLNVIAGSKNIPVQLGASLSGDGKQLKRRLILMLNVKNLSKKTIFLSITAVFAVAVISTSAAVWASGNTPKVAEDKTANAENHTANSSAEPVPSIAPSETASDNQPAVTEPIPVPSVAPADEASESQAAVTEPALVPFTAPSEAASDVQPAVAEPIPVPSVAPADEASESQAAVTEPALVPFTAPSEAASDNQPAVAEPIPVPSIAPAEAVVK